LLDVGWQSPKTANAAQTDLEFIHTISCMKCHQVPASSPHPTHGVWGAQPKDEELIQGKWRIVSNTAWQPPNKGPEAEQDRVVEFVGDKLVSRGQIEITFQLEPNQSPKRMKLHDRPHDDVHRAAIYELNGDDLKLCIMFAESEQFPESFDVRKAKPNTHASTLILKRVAGRATPGDGQDTAGAAKADASQSQAELRRIDEQVEYLHRVKAEAETKIRQLDAAREQVLARKTQEAEAARTKAVLDAKQTLEKAMKAQPNDKTLKMLEEMEKQLQQMKRDLKEKN
jgi:uncharacterized protein (TIGR03067 family)